MRSTSRTILLIGMLLAASVNTTAQTDSALARPVSAATCCWQWCFHLIITALREIFTDKPDLTPYTTLKPEHPLHELNPAEGVNAQASLKLNLDEVDAANEDALNRILWSVIKGTQPYPGTKRMSSLDIAREH